MSGVPAPLPLPPPAPPTTDLSGANDGKAALEREQTQAATLRRLQAIVSLRARIVAWFTDFGWLTFLMAIIAFIVLPSEWYLVLATIIVANGIMYAYTKWIYRPPCVTLVQFRTDDAGSHLAIWVVPLKLWEVVGKVGLTNAVELGNGIGYLIHDIMWADDERTVPLSVTFAWIHWSDLNFATKQKIFAEIRPALQASEEINLRYHSLLDIMVVQKAKELSARWIRLMSRGRYAPRSLEDQAQLRKEIDQLAREKRGLTMSDDPNTAQTVATDEDALWSI